MLKEVLLVGAGGFAGSAVRYLVSAAMSGISCGLPLGTLTVNAAGSLLIGFLLSALAGSKLYLLLAVGFCGGFTTFSAFSAEVLEMIRQGCFARSALYVAASVVISVAAVWCGFQLGGKAS